MTLQSLLDPTPIASATNATAAARSPLELRVLPASARVEALAVWRQLESELQSTRIMCSSLWTEIWLNHFGGWIPHEFVVAARGNRVCGIVLVTHGVQQTAGPFRLKTRHLGTAGEPEAETVCVEYNTILARPDDHGAFQRAVWQHLVRHSGCDELRLDGFEAKSVAELAGLPQTTVHVQPCCYFDFNGIEPGTDVVSQFGTHTRSRIRRTLRELGDYRTEWAQTVDRAEDLFLQMIDLHQARWNAVGLPGVYASPSFRAFHLELLRRAVPLGWMSVFGVFSGRTLIGCNQNLIDSQRVLVYQCGRAPGEGRVSYGVAIDYLNICESLNRGYRAFDLLAGEAEHKRRMTNAATELAWVTWRRRNWKNAAIDAMRAVKTATRRWSSSQRNVTGSPNEKGAST